MEKRSIITLSTGVVILVSTVLYRTKEFSSDERMCLASEIYREIRLLFSFLIRFFFNARLTKKRGKK